MMPGGLSARDRRTLTIGASVVLPLFAAGRGLPAILDWQRTRLRDAIAIAQQAAHVRAAARVTAVLRDSVRARRERLAAIDSLLITGPTPGAAAASLASTLETLADSAPMKVTTMQLRADTAAADALSIVAVRITGFADVAGLAAFLRAVEGGDVPLAVRELSVLQPDPGGIDAKPEILRVDVLVEGLVRVGAVSHP
jgi:hypothetical protein